MGGLGTKSVALDERKKRERSKSRSAAATLQGRVDGLTAISMRANLWTARGTEEVSARDCHSVFCVTFFFCEREEREERERMRESAMGNECTREAEDGLVDKPTQTEYLVCVSVCESLAEMAFCVLVTSGATVSCVSIGRRESARE